MCTSFKNTRLSGGQTGIFLADRVGFEPTSRLRDYLISSQGRYDHFDTCPYLLCYFSKRRRLCQGKLLRRRDLFEKISVFPPYVLFVAERVVGEARGVEIFSVHIHGVYAAVFVSRVVIYAPVGVPAGGVDGYFKFAV